MTKNRVVITGMGVVSPIGNNLNEFWNNLKIGYNGIDDITLFDTEKFDVKIAGESSIDLNDFFDRKELNKLDRFSSFALALSAALFSAYFSTSFCLLFSLYIIQTFAMFYSPRIIN